MLKYFNVYFFLWSVFLFGSSFPYQLYASVNNLSLSKLTVEDGLSQGIVNSILQDNEGFMWLGTESGLNIYDGYSFKTLKGPEGDFDAFEVRIMMQDSNGLLWINVFDKGLYTYNPNTNEYRIILRQVELGKQQFVVEVKQNKDIVWVTTSHRLLTYNTQTQVITPALDLSTELTTSNTINQVAIQGDYFFLATDVGVFVYHTQQKKWKKLPDILSHGQGILSIKESQVYRLHIEQSHLYIGTHASVLMLDISELSNFFNQNQTLPEYQKLAEGLSVWQFYADEDQLYVTSHQGLSVIDLETQQLRYLFSFSDQVDSASDNIIRSITKDNHGVFWLGTNSTGVYLWDPSTELVTNYRYKRNSANSLSYNEVWKILPHHSNAELFWVATGNGLNLINNTQQTVASYLVDNDLKEIYGSSRIFQMAYYDDNTLLLGTYEGLKTFDLQTKSIITSPYSDEINALFSLDLINLFVDEAQNIWCATKQGIYKVSLKNQTIDKVFEPLVEEAYKNVKQDITNLLGFLPNSTLLMFSNNDSLWAFDTAKKEARLLYRYPEQNFAEWAYIDNWLIDKNNVLWLSFSNQGLIGLSLSDFSLAYHYHKNNSTIQNYIYGLQMDDDGDLWFSSHNGLFMMDRETHHFRNFGTRNGLVNKEFNGGAAATLPNNLFAYGGMLGLSVFDPLRMKNVSQPLFSVRVSKVDVLSRSMNLPMFIDTTQPIELGYDDVGIRIDFSTLDYTYKHLVRYQYRLTGQDVVEYPLTHDNSITFPLLPSGNHTLEVSAESPISGEFSKPIRIQFSVSYAPWASPVAYFIYFILGVGIILIWLLKHTQQKQALITAHEAVKYREHRLQLALIGSNSEVWDWQAHNNVIFAKRAKQDLNLNHFADSYSFEEHLGLIHPEDKNTFLTSWMLFLKQNHTDSNFACTYRLKSRSGQWFWYKDLGKIVELAADGTPSRVTGSYQNITASKAAEERAIYYGDAFRHTQDWVFIISDNFTKVTANKALCRVFNWENDELNFDRDLFGFSEEKKRYYGRIFRSLKEGKHWKGEEIIRTANDEEYHVIFNISASRNTANNKLHFICIFTDITAQKMAEKELRYLANYDHLTALPNRSLLLERIQHAMDYSRQKNTSIALFFIDLDRFKQINDSLGHDYGDLLLKEITRKLTSILRADDTVARIGGDEFVVLLEYFKGNQQLGQIAQKIIASIGEPITLNSHVVSVGASIGIALYPEDANNSDELLHHADVAMYHSKQLGRNTYQFFTERMNYEANTRLQLESNLKQALYNQEFVNHYQPIVNALSQQTIGLELLLRWQTKEGLIPPLEFIPRAEELGLILDITEQAITRGLADLVKWRETHSDLFLSVNISPCHFIKDSLLPFIKDQLAIYNLPSSALKIEITESALIVEPEKAITTMKALSNLGILLALDDFGTGYSSLSYLKQLPLDILKIDRAFITGINESDADEAIVDAIIVLANRLNMTCIAEGVETKGQLEYLMEQHCYNIQGYLYSRPMDEDSVSQYLLASKVEQ